MKLIHTYEYWVFNVEDNFHLFQQHPPSMREPTCYLLLRTCLIAAYIGVHDKTADPVALIWCMMTETFCWVSNIFMKGSVNHNLLSVEAILLKTHLSLLKNRKNRLSEIQDGALGRPPEDTLGVPQQLASNSPKLPGECHYAHTDVGLIKSLLKPEEIHGWTFRGNNRTSPPSPALVPVSHYFTILLPGSLSPGSLACFSLPPFQDFGQSPF